MSDAQPKATLSKAVMSMKVYWLELGISRVILTIYFVVYEQKKKFIVERR